MDGLASQVIGAPKGHWQAALAWLRRIEANTLRPQVVARMGQMLLRVFVCEILFAQLP